MSQVPDNSSVPSGLVAKGRAGDNAEPLTISEISSALKRTVEDRFGFVRVRGEISRVSRPRSGHIYTTLKDEKANLDAVIWKGNASRLSFAPEEGLEVVATGKLTTYPGQSKYQIVIEQMEIAGEGALLALLEKTRARLAAEGLFDEGRKRRPPYLPTTIGVVTSPTGAVIRDILHRLADRFPSHVLVWPVLVQGQGAAEQVANAVRGFGALEPDGAIPRPDVLIVARGGGSIEDLWGFNEEVVVRAVAESPIPVISAVGHETDTTLCDFAADLRAPTPTAAAEMAVPVKRDLSAYLDELALRQKRSVARPLELGRERLEARVKRLPMPANLLAPQQQRLDELSERNRRGLADRASKAREALYSDAARLSAPLLKARVERARERLERAGLTSALLQSRMRKANEALAPMARVLPQLNPDQPLKRGFARITDADGRTLTSIEQAAVQPSMTIRFADGGLDVAPLDGEAPAPRPGPAPPKRAKKTQPKRKGPDPAQDDLFGGE